MRRFMIGGAFLLILAGCGGEDPRDPESPDIARTDVYVTNFSGETILEVNLRPAGVDGWGANWLRQPIPGGVLYTFIGQVVSGTYDVRMIGSFSSREFPGMQCVGDAVGIGFPAQPSPAAR